MIGNGSVSGEFSSGYGSCLLAMGTSIGDASRLREVDMNLSTPGDINGVTNSSLIELLTSGGSVCTDA